MKKFLVAAISFLIALPSEGAWKKTVTKGGKTTVTGDAQTMADLEREKKMKAAYQKAIGEAPRRKSTDPIHVVFVYPSSKKERKKQKMDGLHRGLLKEFKGDPLLKVISVDLPRGKRAMGSDYKLPALIRDANKKGKSGDVYVLAHIGTEDAVGKNRKSGKLYATKALVYKATLQSAYDSKKRKVKEKGTVFQNVEIVKNLAKKITKVIKKDMGPNLPSREAVAKITNEHMLKGVRAQTGINEGDDTKTILKKLFSPRKRNK